MCIRDRARGAPWTEGVGTALTAAKSMFCGKAAARPTVAENKTVRNMIERVWGSCVGNERQETGL